MVIEQLSLGPGASASALFIEVSVLGTEPGAEETVADSSAMSLLSQSVGSGSARQVANHQRIRSETSGRVGKQGGELGVLGLVRQCRCPVRGCCHCCLVQSLPL